MSAARVLLFTCLFPGVVCAQGNITTYAGGGGRFTGDGKPAVTAQIARPSDVAVDAKGNVYFTSPPLNLILKIAIDGTLSIVAGNGLGAHSGDGGPARAAALFQPLGVRVDAAGNVYIVDSDSIRVVDTAGTIRAIAGNGFGYSGDTVPAISAGVAKPKTVAVDAKGNVFIADNYNCRVRMVNAAGAISTVAGTGTCATTGDGGPATSASLGGPYGLAVDAAGAVYVSGANRVRKFTVGGTISTFAGTGGGGFSGDGGTATTAQLFGPQGLAFDSAGNLYIAELLNSRIRRVSPNGIITTVAGNGRNAFSGEGGPATQASLGNPLGVAAAPDGSIYIADTENDRIRKVDPNGVISTVSGIGAYLGDGGDSTAARMTGGYPYEVAVDRSGNLYIMDGNDRRVRKVTPSGTISTFAGTGRIGSGGDGGLAVMASLDNPQGIAVDSAGNVYISDDRLRVVGSDGTISTFANISPGFLAIDSKDNLYVLGYVPGGSGPSITKVTPAGAISHVAGNGQSGFSGDGGPATNASFGSYTGGLIVAPDGSILVSDAANNRIRRIDPSGTVTTFGGDGAAGTICNGGQPSASRFGNARGMAYDSKGNLYIATSNQICKVSAQTGAVTLYAGNGRAGSSGDGGSALAAAMNFPLGIAIDRNDSLYIADSTNSRVRLVQPGAGPFLLLSQKGLTFKVGATSLAQSLTVVNSGQGTVNWAVSTSVASGATNWLSATPASGSSPAGQAGPPITVKADPTGLAPGDYYGQIVVTAPGVPNSPQSVTVVLSVPAAGVGGSTIQPAGLLFTATAGGADPATQNLTLTTTTAAGTKFGSSVVFGDGRPWFTFQPISGTVQSNAPVTMQVKPAISGFSAGVYNAVITVAFDDNTVSQVNLVLVVSAGTGVPKPGLPGAGCAPSKQVPLFTSIGPGFSATVGWPAPIEVRVVDDCGNLLVKGSVTASFSNNDPALPLNSLLDGRWTATWQVGKSGSVSVTVAAQDAGGSVSGTAQISGGLTANPNPPPVIASGGVLDAASYQLNSSVAPGSLVSIFGQFLSQQDAKAGALPLPTTLGITQVTVAGRPMPLLFAGGSQVNAMIPYDLPINATHQIVIRRGNTISIPEPVSLLSSRSGVFTRDLTGKGAAIVVKVATDGTQTIVSSATPASAYDAIVIYADGLGNVDPQAIAGSETPISPLSQTLDPVTVTIGGISAPVVFAGLTPGFTGLYQINAYVPTGVAPGDNVPLVISQAGRASSSVTIAVR
jgi:uncharacterized protein (TIGR03437 family)